METSCETDPQLLIVLNLPSLQLPSLHLPSLYLPSLHLPSLYLPSSSLVDAESDPNLILQGDARAEGDQPQHNHHHHQQQQLAAAAAAAAHGPNVPPDCADPAVLMAADGWFG